MTILEVRVSHVGLFITGRALLVKSFDRAISHPGMVTLVRKRHEGVLLKNGYYGSHYASFVHVRNTPTYCELRYCHWCFAFALTLMYVAKFIM